MAELRVVRMTAGMQSHEGVARTPRSRLASVAQAGCLFASVMSLGLVPPSPVVGVPCVLAFLAMAIAVRRAQQRGQRVQVLAIVSLVCCAAFVLWWALG